MHIEIISLVDGTYELIQEPDVDISKAQVNITVDNEDLNMNPESESELHEVQPTSKLTEVPNFNSEELKPTDSIDSTKGKPRCIIILF